jgi:hypothetical protein
LFRSRPTCWRRHLLEKTAELTDEEREAVGKYLEAATEVFRRHARG